MASGIRDAVGIIPSSPRPGAGKEAGEVGGTIAATKGTDVRVLA
jgi:hypothetical protein